MLNRGGHKPPVGALAVSVFGALADIVFLVSLRGRLPDACVTRVPGGLRVCDRFAGQVDDGCSVSAADSRARVKRLASSLADRAWR